MEDRELKAEIVKSGTWVYGDSVIHEVWIVKQNFDFYYEEGFDSEPEQLNENGETYHVIFASAGRVRSVTTARHTLAESIALAEEKLPKGITWLDHRIQDLFHGRQYALDPECVSNAPVEPVQWREVTGI
jgi:hypothetical protein